MKAKTRIRVVHAVTVAICGGKGELELTIGMKGTVKQVVGDHVCVQFDAAPHDCAIVHVNYVKSEGHFDHHAD